MKTTKIVSVVTIAVVALATAGCQSRMNPFKSKQAAAVNPTAPPVSVSQSLPAQSVPQNVTQVAGATRPIPSTAPSRSQRRPQWVPVSVFNNLLDARSGVAMNGASVLVTNKRAERVAIQIGDRLLGVPDDNGGLGVAIIGPGESFAVYDPGLGQKIALKAIVINDSDQRLGYVGTMVSWPRTSSQEGIEVQWDIVSGYPDPMVLLPSSPGSMSSAAPVLTPLPGPTPALPVIATTPAVPAPLGPPTPPASNP